MISPMLHNAFRPRLPPQDELSGADIKAMCTEAGLLALRERRMRVTQVRAPGGERALWCWCCCWC